MSERAFLETLQRGDTVVIHFYGGIYASREVLVLITHTTPTQVHTKNYKFSRKHGKPIGSTDHFSGCYLEEATEAKIQEITENIYREKWAQTVRQVINWNHKSITMDMIKRMEAILDERQSNPVP